MKSIFGNFNKEKKSTWTPRIVTLLVTLVAILAFYPRVDEDNLYRFKEGQVWDHGDLVTQDTLIVPPDSMAIKALEDSIRSTFVYVYTPMDPSEVNVSNIADSVDRYIMLTISSMNGDQLPEHLNSHYYVLRDNIRHNLAKAYRGKVIDLPGAMVKPERIALSEDSRRFTDEITTVDEILEGITHSAESQEMPPDIVEKSDIARFIVPNVVLNNEISQERLTAELGLEIDGRTRVYAPGYMIIQRGDVVSPKQGRMITMYTQQMLSKGDNMGHSTLLLILGQVVYILLLITVLVGYMRFYAKNVWDDNRAFIFIVSLVGVMVIISAIASRMLSLGLYIVPLAIVPILVQVFFHGRTALWTGVITALLCAGMSNQSFQYFVIQFVGIAMAVFSLRDLTKRSQILATSVLVGVGYIITYIAYRWMAVGAFDGILGRMVSILAISAVLTSICYVLMFGVERVFGFISSVTLLELTDVNTPLLRSLSDQCPGTFNHVVAVSNLADDAARQIGANALLTRAGAMYHDIGKLANPMYFTENQHGINPHDGLTPKQSAQIIIGHVSEGLKLAEKAGLPQSIRDFIREHHGAGKAKYFYYTYCKQHPDEQVDEAPFTYPGPNPRSRETSILMMADAVEAASRSLKEHSPKAISELVDNIINGQIADGLHNDSPLSFHDVSVIKDVFKRRLMTMYHSRIAYPEDPTKKKEADSTPKNPSEESTN